MKNIILIVILLFAAIFGYKYYQNHKNAVAPDVQTNSMAVTDNPTNYKQAIDFDDIPPTYVDSDDTSTSTSILNPISTSQPSSPSFACDGRQHCSQMTSCAEATYFLQHCPNTKMDGNNDGIPCEQQWCK